jgi:CheY-like chemotaxis protein
MLSLACQTQRGVGLGVTLASRTIELLGGVLTIKSQVGRGTICRIELPLKLQNEHSGSDDGRSEDQFDAFSPPRAVAHPISVIGFDECDKPSLLRAGRCLRRQIRARDVAIIPRLDVARLIICEAEYDLAKNHPEVLSRRLVDGRRVIMLGAAGHQPSSDCLRVMRELGAAMIHCEYMTRPITPLLVERLLVHPEERHRQITAEAMMEDKPATFTMPRPSRSRVDSAVAAPAPALPISLDLDKFDNMALKGDGDDDSKPSVALAPPALLTHVSEYGSVATVKPDHGNNTSPGTLASPVQTNDAPLPSASSSPYDGCIKVLIVEDNEMNRKVLVKAVKLTGVPHEIAVDGVEAVELYKSWQPTVGAWKTWFVRGRYES